MTSDAARQHLFDHNSFALEHLTRLLRTVEITSVPPELEPYKTYVLSLTGQLIAQAEGNLEDLRQGALAPEDCASSAAVLVTYVRLLSQH